MTEQMLLAGTSALAEKTMLNGDVLIDYAVDKSGFNQKELKNELLDPYEQMRIEEAVDEMLDELWRNVDGNRI